MSLEALRFDGRLSSLLLEALLFDRAFDLRLLSFRPIPKDCNGGLEPSAYVYPLFKSPFLFRNSYRFVRKARSRCSPFSHSNCFIVMSTSLLSCRWYCGMSMSSSSGVRCPVLLTSLFNMYRVLNVLEGSLQSSGLSCLSSSAVLLPGGMPRAIASSRSFALPAALTRLVNPTDFFVAFFLALAALVAAFCFFLSAMSFLDISMLLVVLFAGIVTSLRGPPFLRKQVSSGCLHPLGATSSHLQMAQRSLL